MCFIYVSGCIGFMKVCRFFRPDQHVVISMEIEGDIFGDSDESCIVDDDQHDLVLDNVEQDAAPVRKRRRNVACPSTGALRVVALQWSAAAEKQRVVATQAKEVFYARFNETDKYREDNEREKRGERVTPGERRRRRKDRKKVKLLEFKRPEQQQPVDLFKNAPQMTGQIKPPTKMA